LYSVLLAAMRPELHVGDTYGMTEADVPDVVRLRDEISERLRR
jgi:hypothetical protein